MLCFTPRDDARLSRRRGDGGEGTSTAAFERRILMYPATSNAAIVAWRAFAAHLERVALAPFLTVCLPEKKTWVRAGERSGRRSAGAVFGVPACDPKTPKSDIPKLVY